MLEVVDPRLQGVYNELEVLMVIKLGSMCSNNDPARRPSMRQATRFLEGEEPLPETVAAQHEFDGKDGEGFEGSENSYTSSSYCEYDGAEDVDLEAGSTSTTLSGRGDSWSLEVKGI